MELEVEEDGATPVPEVANHPGTFGREELKADFEPPAQSLEPIGEVERGASVGKIESYDQARVHADRVQRAGYREQSEARGWEQRR